MSTEYTFDGLDEWEMKCYTNVVTVVANKI